jgi:hypothetical protein
MASSSPRGVLSVTIKAAVSQVIALKFSMVASFPQDAYWAAVLQFPAAVSIPGTLTAGGLPSAAKKA